MRIYGKTLSEIFTLLPWPYKAVVVLGAAFFIFAVPYSLRYFVTMGIVVDKVEPITFPGLSRTANKGVLDPAIATDGKNVVMVHTLLGLEGTGNDQQLSAEVALETSQPPCRAWASLPNGFPVNKTTEEMGPDGMTPLPAGAWRAETPGIVFDPDDRGAEWKTFAYRYYWTGSEKLARLYGYISMRTAHDIYSDWSNETLLFGAAKNYPPEPYNSLVQQHLNDLSPDLQDVYFYSRPSLVYISKYKILFMTLSAFVEGTKSPDRIVMLKSFDHGKTWKYAGTPLKAADLAKIGDYTKLGGATLVEYPQGKQLYLAAVFGNKTAEGLGAFMLPFDNPMEGKLKLDEKTGAPAVAFHHARNSAQPSKLGGGYSAYSDDCKVGMLMSEYSDLRASFQIFKTYKKPVPQE